MQIPLHLDQGGTEATNPAGAAENLGVVSWYVNQAIADEYKAKARGNIDAQAALSSESKTITPESVLANSSSTVEKYGNVVCITIHGYLTATVPTTGDRHIKIATVSEGCRPATYFCAFGRLANVSDHSICGDIYVDENGAVYTLVSMPGAWVHGSITFII